jgi:hypothetical protein
LLTPDWYRFFGTELGAIAGLTGFVLVAISLNLKIILATPGLAGRSAEALIAPVGAITIGGLIFLPGQPPAALGVEILVVALLMVGAPIMIQTRNRDHNKTLPARVRLLRFFISAGVSFLFVVGGALILFNAASGLYWIAAGDLLLVMAIAISAWVLMIEILR